MSSVRSRNEITGKDRLDDVPEVNFLPVPREDLPIGRAVTFSIYDARGVLLLAKGSIITPRFLERLREQDIRTVHVPGDDVARFEEQEESQQAELCASLLDLHTSTTLQLDRLAEDPGNLIIQNSSIPFRSQVASRLGAIAYDVQLAQEMVECETTSLSNVANMLDGILQFRKGGNLQHHVVRQYMNYMKRDLDMVVATAALPGSVASIYRHSLHLCILGMAIATELQYDPYQVFVVGLTGLLHDVGMLRVPKRVRQLNRRLTIAQHLDVMKHVIHSANLLEDLPGVPNATRLASYQIHERCNSIGYPRRRVGSQIHPIARILGAADAYLSYITPCFGRRPMLPYASMVRLLRQTHRGQFDRDVVRSLLHVLSLYPIGSHVILNDGRAGKVIRSNGPLYDRPVVQILRGVDGDCVQGMEIVDLSVEADLGVVQTVRQIDHEEPSTFSPHELLSRSY